MNEEHRCLNYLWGGKLRCQLDIGHAGGHVYHGEDYSVQGKKDEL